MKTTTKTIISLAAVLLLSLLVSQQTEETLTPTQRLLQTGTYTTTSTRTQNVVDLCPANLDRSTLVNNADVTAAVDMRATVTAEMGVDGNTLIRTAVDGNLSGAIEMLQNGMTKFAMYVGAFAVGFVIFLLIWPFLCCCCTCPYCCPSKCCQKPPDEQYSKCELYWPTITLILALLLTMGASIYGFTKVSSFGPSISNMGCSTAIFVDDLLNGNVTTNGTDFFTGLNTLSANLDDLVTKLPDINGNFSDLTGTTPGTGAGQSKSQLAKDNVESVRDNKVKVIPKSTSPFEIDWFYQDDIGVAATSATAVPVFKSVLGIWSTNTTVVGGLYEALDKIATFIGDAKTQATDFQSTMGTVSGQVNNMKANISTIVNSISDVDNNMKSPMSTVKTAGSNGNMGLQAFYGIMIGFSFFTLLGALLTACCDKYKCRYLMYFSCIFLFLAGLIGFLLSSLFSVMIPPMTWGCSFIETALGSSSGFTSNLGGALGSSTANMLATCMPFGDGNIINSLLPSGGALNSLNNLTSVIEKMKEFNASQYEGWISGNLTKAMGTIRTWCRGEVVDVDGANFNLLSSFSVSSSWSSCTGTHSLSDDSWVPSNSQNSTSPYVTIPCQAMNGQVGDGTTCSATLTDASGTCGGCMSSAALVLVQPSATSLKSALDTRYSAACTLNAKLENVWTNYYLLKNSKYGPTDTGSTGTVLGRAELANTAILANTTSSGGVFESINIMGTLFTDIINAMTLIQPLVDPKYGLLAGLNCKIFGQDFTRIQNILCGSMYYNIYLMRYALGISCYGILFAMCCIVCTGVRHMKHAERKERVGDAFAKLKHEESGSMLKTKD